MPSRGAARAARVIARALTALWWLVAAAGTLAVAALAVELARGARLRVSLPAVFAAAAGARARGTAPGLARPAVSGLAGTVSVSVPDSVGLAALAAVAAGTVLALAVAWQLRALFASLAAGTPFAPRNAGRIRWIAAAVAAAELARAAAVWASGRWLGTRVSVPGLQVRAEFAPRWEILGLAVLCALLAEVFALGTRLQDDHDLTI